MTEQLVFISYKHEEPWSEMAARLYQKLKNVAFALKFEVYIDKTMLGGELWRREIAEKIERTTHFVAFICDDYWASFECQRELIAALNRHEAARGEDKPGPYLPHLLFVRAGAINPRYFTLEEARLQGSLTSPNPSIGKLADVNFLGPLDANGKLEIMARKDKDPGRLDDQLAQLLERLKATLK